MTSVMWTAGYNQGYADGHQAASSGGEAQESSPPSQPSLRIPWDRWRIKTDQRLEALEERHTAQGLRIAQNKVRIDQLEEASRLPSSSGEDSWNPAPGLLETRCPSCRANLLAILELRPMEIMASSRSTLSTAGESEETAPDSSIPPPTSE